MLSLQYSGHSMKGPYYHMGNLSPPSLPDWGPLKWIAFKTGPLAGLELTADQAGFRFRDLLVINWPGLGLEVCATMPGVCRIFFVFLKTESC